MENSQSSWVRFLLHLHPKRVNSQAIKFNRTFGLGGINALLFVILAITGVLLRFKYIPTVDDAYDSIIILQQQFIFGKLLRNIHHWSAVLMIISAFLHLLRVFFSQSIYYERKKNWFFGLVMFLFVVAFNFTGYLLPWDQLSFWAVTIVTGMLEYIPWIGESLANAARGGESVSQSTLLNFYSFHTGLLPILFIIFMSLHFWQIRKAKGVTYLPNENAEMKESYPFLVNREILVGLGLIVLVLVLGVFSDAELMDKANPALSPNPSKAPWYFMGFQELLMHIHPLFAVLVLPGSTAFLLVYIAYSKQDHIKVGVWFNSKNGKRATITSVVFSGLFTVLLIIIDNFVLKGSIGGNLLPAIISNGLLPFLMYVIPVGIFVFLLFKKFQLVRIEVMMSIISIILTSYIVMTFIGIFLRGEGMALTI